MTHEPAHLFGGCTSGFAKVRTLVRASVPLVKLPHSA
jgi:hypothetical protein